MANNDAKICQYIVVDKKLNMSPGKLCAQISHASMAFLTNMLRKGIQRTDDSADVACSVTIPSEIWDGWIDGVFTKVVLAAKGRSGLDKVVEKAKENGLVEGEDFFCIRDNCLTELTPDETGTCFTCIGFKPMPKDVLMPVVGKLQLYR